MRIISMGEVLWDVIGAEEYLGGAPLNFSAAAHRLGNTVANLTAVGADARGARAISAMRELGLTTEFVQTSPALPTGTAVVVIDSAGNVSFVIDRPAAFDDAFSDHSIMDRLIAFNPDWIYFGTLAQTNLDAEDMLANLVQSLPGARCFYDMNLRTGHWNLPLVQRLSRLAAVLKLNETEAEILFQLTSSSGKFELEEFCRHWSATCGIDTICVTRGSKGCVVFREGQFHAFAGYSVKVADTVGAGDAFAAAFLHGLHHQWPLEKIASFANALGALVTSRSGAIPDWTIDECLRLATFSDAKSTAR